MIDATIVEHLLEDEAVNALVGDRIWPLAADVDEMEATPFLVYAVDTVFIPTLSGTLPTAEYTLTVTAADRHHAGMLSVMAAVREALDGWNDDEAGVEWASIQTEQTAITEDGSGYAGTQTYRVFAAV